MGLNYSVNTNAGALVALQNLNQTSRDLQVTQNRVNTGRKVDTARDNGATWAIAQNQASKSFALGAINDSLDRGKSTVDVAMSAASTIADTLNQMRTKALAASETSLDSASRTTMNKEYAVLRDQISKLVSSSEFNGFNLIKSGAANFVALANDTGGVLTITGVSLALGGATITIAATSSISTASLGTSQSSAIATSIKNLNQALAVMGAQAKRLDAQNVFISKLRDALDTGVGNLVDADLARESARLTALQTKQQLGTQALSIANQSSAILQNLFR
jgi:flagellin